MEVKEAEGLLEAEVEKVLSDLDSSVREDMFEVVKQSFYLGYELGVRKAERSFAESDVGFVEEDLY
jgi:cob(I)alamin adenosyltransferase